MKIGTGEWETSAGSFYFKGDRTRVRPGSRARYGQKRLWVCVGLSSVGRFELTTYEVYGDWD